MPLCWDPGAFGLTIKHVTQIISHGHSIKKQTLAPGLIKQQNNSKRTLLGSLSAEVGWVCRRTGHGAPWLLCQRPEARNLFRASVLAAVARFFQQHFCIRDALKTSIVADACWAMSSAVLLKPSEYQGAGGTAVAGRIVILRTEVVEQRGKQAMATAAKAKGGKMKQAKVSAGPSRKLEMHLSGTGSTGGVLYVEAWGELAQQARQRCRI